MSANVFELVCLNRYRQAKLVLEAGGDPNFRNERDETPLMACSMYLREPDRRSYLTRMLLRFGADVNAQNDKGQTVLMYTCILNQIDSMLVLLEQSDIDLDRQDETGNTSLMYACALGRGPAVYVFLEVYRRKQHHLNLYCTNHAGQTARQIAEEHNFVHIQDLFTETLDNDYWSSYMELSRDMPASNSYPLNVEDPTQIPGLAEHAGAGDCLSNYPDHPLASMVEHVLQVSKANVPVSTNGTHETENSNDVGVVCGNSLDNRESDTWEGVVRQQSSGKGSMKTENSFDSSVEDDKGHQKQELIRRGSAKCRRRKAKNKNPDLEQENGEENGLIREKSFGKSIDISSKEIFQSEDEEANNRLVRRGSVKTKKENKPYEAQADPEEGNPGSARDNGGSSTGRRSTKPNPSNGTGTKEANLARKSSFTKADVTSNGEHTTIHPSGIPKAPQSSEERASKSRINLYARHSFQEDDVEHTEGSLYAARPPQTPRRSNIRQGRRNTTELNVTVVDGKIVSTSPRRKRDRDRVRTGKSRTRRDNQRQEGAEGNEYGGQVDDCNNTNIDERVESGYSSRSRSGAREEGVRLTAGDDGVKLTARSKQKANMCSGDFRPLTGAHAYTPYASDADIERSYGYPMVDEYTRDYVTSARSRDMVLNGPINGDVGPRRHLYEPMNVRGTRQSHDFGYEMPYDTASRALRMPGDSVVVAGSAYASQRNPYGLSYGEYDSVPTHRYMSRESSPRRYSKANAW